MNRILQICFSSLSDEFDKTTLELFAVNETIPELEENFEIILSTPEGGAKLGPVNKRPIRILPNDSPYGLITILPLVEGEIDVDGADEVSLDSRGGGGRGG